MNAPQDTWAAALALRMINRFRSKALTYIKIVPGTYDEETGTIENEETSYPAVGAVTLSRKKESDAVLQGHWLTAWVDHQTVPWPISCNDNMDYLGKRWKVVSIESYGSGQGATVGPIYITTLDGKIITTLDGKAIIVNGTATGEAEYTMYASKILARAE